jgi:cysteine-rich repeat protein
LGWFFGLVTAGCVACSGSGGGADPVCGNGVLEAGEQCDDGAAEGAESACSETCTWQELTVPAADSASEPWVSVSPTGHFVVVYQLRDGFEFDVQAVVFDRNGMILQAPLTLSAATDGNQTRPRVAAGPDGAFVAVWEQGSEGDRDVQVRWFGSQEDGYAPQGPAQQVNQDTQGDQHAPAVAWHVGGGAVVTWTGLFVDGDGAGVLGRMFGAGRQPLDDGFVVNTYWEDDQKESSVASAPDGRFLIAWESKCQESG